MENFRAEAGKVKGDHEHLTVPEGGEVLKN